jgi:hypothetical protein
MGIRAYFLFNQLLCMFFILSRAFLTSLLLLVEAGSSLHPWEGENFRPGAPSLCCKNNRSVAAYVITPCYKVHEFPQKLFSALIVDQTAQRL